ncbi:5'-methylthioadenosine/S-adenosylhomocysteine nucleosidase [Bdellovibrio bacteriovorus]|uniref:5'-methylthioadenosine/S-adenosylhomocysteine nucleosidase family protein n=1 Tax=Bdellovibrio bacteriovorus TaxID=959 RepID=UPI0021CF37C0|nr:5'-methylthioadenosine/S-adenosylhomocysteine nucleosidase [Bdellovibrio bacteriovorus]UXR66082.1 5'-methylthioadenosine/S-adenosylhomocysteine nucleosidase [Bdellovibrio bacteriovorus]
MTNKTVLILVAMKEELQDIQTEASPALYLKPFSVPVWELAKTPVRILAAQVGIGPINASSVLTTLLSECKIDAVLLLGLGGAIDDRLKIGDTCISTHVIQHDAVCSKSNGIEYMACGEAHLSLQPHQRPNIRLESSPEFSQELARYLRQHGHRVHEGTILSGSEFVGSHSKKLHLKQVFNDALMVDMEACAIAYLCNKAQIPFTIAKTVADTLSPSPSEEYLDFLKSSSKKALDIIHFWQEKI